MRRETKKNVPSFGCHCHLPSILCISTCIHEKEKGAPSTDSPFKDRLARLYGACASVNDTGTAVLQCKHERGIEPGKQEITQNGSCKAHAITIKI